MSPIFEIECMECGARKDEILKRPEDLQDEVCSECGGKQLQLGFTAPANYTISGNNSASTRPRKSRSNQ